MLAVCTLAACAQNRDGSAPHPSATAEFAGVDPAYAAGHVLMHEKRAGMGTYCAVLNPGQNLRTTPVSYRAADLGKAGVPTPKPRDVQMLRSIEHYVHSPTLRFVYSAQKFIVYDAIDGPCTGSAPGYFALNGGCNEFYMPSKQDDYTVAVPGCLSPPRPWIPHDRGQGNPASWASPGPH